MAPAIRIKGRVYRIRIMLNLHSHPGVISNFYFLPNDHERLFFPAFHTISLLSLPDNAYLVSPLGQRKGSCSLESSLTREEVSGPFRGAWRARLNPLLPFRPRQFQSGCFTSTYIPREFGASKVLNTEITRGMLKGCCKNYCSE
jgi:hypothetical protein